MSSYTIKEINGIPYFVIKDDGINISRVKFPHNMEIGLPNSNYSSNLLVRGTISGSIHHTKDGLPYLVAGSGISIASASNGQVTITSAGGGGGAISSVVNGANNRIATFTSADALSGEANLTFNGSTLDISGDIQTSGDLLLHTSNPSLIKNNTYLKLQSTGSIWVQIDDGGTETSSFRIYSGSQIIMNVESGNFSTTFPAGDVFITNNNDLRLNTGGTIVLDNNSDSEIYLSSSNGSSLDIDGNNLLRLYADNNLYHYLGDHQAGIYSRNSFHAGSNTFNLDNDDMDFRVHTSNYEGTFFVDAGDDTVIIGAQDFDSTPAASELLSKGYGNDVKIMLSGTYGTKDSSTRGVVLMTGDTAVSGNLHIVGDTYSKRKITSSGSLEIRSINGSTYVVGDNNVSVWIGYDGNGSDQSFSIYKGTGGYEQIFVVSEDKSVRIFGELDVESNLVVHLDYDSDNSNSYFGTKNGGGTFNQVFYEDGRAYFNWSRQSGGDFIVNGDNDYGLIFVDAGEDAVALGSSTDGSPAWSEFTETGTDVKILLSGTIGSKDSTTRGVVLVPGDMVISGTLYNGAGNQINGVSDFMTNGSNNRVITATGTDAMNAEANLTFNGSTLSITGDISLSGDINCTSTPLTIGSVGDVSILLDTNNNSTNKFKIINGGGLEVFTVNESGYFESIGSADFTLDSNNNEAAYFIIRNGSGDAQAYIAETGESWFNFSRNTDGDFQVRGSSDYGLIFTDAGENAVALGYNGDANPEWSELTETGTDVKILLSGTVGSKDGSTRGVTLAAGDFAASGSIYTGGNLLSLDSTLALNASSEVSSFVSSNKNATYSSATEFNTNRADVDFEVNTDDYYGTFFIDGNDNTIIIGHELFDNSPSASEVSGYGNDVKIMLSGSAGSKDTSNRGVVLVTGDLVVSGTAHLTNLTSPGSILSFRNFNTVNAEDFDVPTSYNFIEGSTSGKAYITFDSPSTGNVELEFSVYVEQTSSNADLFMALSTNGTTWTTISNTDVKVFDGDELDDGYLTFKWILTGLTPGTSYTYYFGAESNTSTGIDLKWGKASAAIGYPPLIMKATALPNTIT